MNGSVGDPSKDPNDVAPFLGMAWGGMSSGGCMSWSPWIGPLTLLWCRDTGGSCSCRRAPVALLYPPLLLRFTVTT